MADLTYPYLVEGVTFDAASLNTRFGGVACCVLDPGRTRGDVEREKGL